MFQPSDMNTAVQACDDFYNHAIGGWKEKNPLENHPEWPAWNSFIALHELNQERLKELVDNISKEGSTASGPSQKLADYYLTAMDEEAIEAKGVAVLAPLFAKCSVDAVESNCTDVIADLLKLGARMPFSVSESPDKANSSWTILSLSQSGLGLPDKDYYFDEDKEEKRGLYVKHIATMFKLAHGYDEEKCQEVAEAIFKFELEMAGNHMTRTELRDPEKTYNKMSVAELQNRCSEGNVDFARFFERLGKSAEDLGDINVRTVDALVKGTKQLKSTDPEILSNYFQWSVIRNHASFDLPKAFADEHFDFYEKALKGTQEQKQRWKRALGQAEASLGDILGQCYVDKYFDTEAKAKALNIVEDVRVALEQRLKEVDFFTADSTREMALKKMEAFKVKIGFPDEWVDYSSLEIVKGDHFGNQLRVEEFELKRTLGFCNAATDRSRWFMTPQTVNAYYHPSLNEIVFPAAILQPPFYDKNAPDAINFGAMGAVVGHEMTHGFDDQGRKYDANGNMVDWWTEADAAEYERRVDVMIKQAEEFKVHGVPLKGKLTCGENIADLGGVKLSQRALINNLKKKGQDPDAPEEDGTSPRQKFFFSWARCWAQNAKKERELQLVTIDPHGPNQMRANCPLSNTPEFYTSFQITEGSPMYIDPKDRVDIW
eukprot:m.15559 g.15559  ORF g.15559 m.15559 type:complete len:659 (-) comp5430_c0_seq2:113-2089(-)